MGRWEGVAGGGWEGVVGGGRKRRTGQRQTGHSRDSCFMTFDLKSSQYEGEREYWASSIL